MYWRVLLNLSALLALLPASATAATPLERIEKDYPDALSRLEAFYRRVKVSATVKHTQLNATEQPVSNCFWEFSRAEDYHKYRRYCAGAPADQISDEVFCRNPERYLFSLGRELPTEAYRVMAIMQPEPILANTPEAYAFRYLDCTYSVFGVPISKMRADPSFRITDAQDVDDGVEKLIRVDYEFSPTDGTTLGQGCLVVAPERMWALVRYECEDHPPESGGKVGHISAVMQYGAPSDGIPIPKRAEVQVAFAGRPIWREECDFVEVVASDIPKSDFTLAAYGISEDEAPGAQRVKRRLPLVIAIALTGLAALLVRRLARRKRLADRQTPSGAPVRTSSATPRGERDSAVT